jgi:hypothetical protein
MFSFEEYDGPSWNRRDTYGKYTVSSVSYMSLPAPSDAIPLKYRVAAGLISKASELLKG